MTPCSTPGCGYATDSLGLCRACRATASGHFCEVTGCGRPAPHVGSAPGKYLCSRCASRKRAGIPLDRPLRDQRRDACCERDGCRRMRARNRFGYCAPCAAILTQNAWCCECTKRLATMLDYEGDPLCERCDEELTDVRGAA